MCKLMASIHVKIWFLIFSTVLSTLHEIFKPFYTLCFRWFSPTVCRITENGRPRSGGFKISRKVWTCHCQTWASKKPVTRSDTEGTWTWNINVNRILQKISKKKKNLSVTWWVLDGLDTNLGAFAFSPRTTRVIWQQSVGEMYTEIVAKLVNMLAARQLARCSS